MSASDEPTESTHNTHGPLQKAYKNIKRQGDLERHHGFNEKSKRTTQCKTGPPKDVTKFIIKEHITYLSCLKQCLKMMKLEKELDQ